jgi:hypothetical protein
MPQFQIQVGNGGGDLQPLADSLIAMAVRLDMALTTIVGKDVNDMDVTMRAHPRSTPQEVLADLDLQGQIVRRVP